MKEVIERILREQIDFSIYPAGGPTPEDIAQKIADELIKQGFDWGTALGGPGELDKEAGNG